MRYNKGFYWQFHNDLGPCRSPFWYGGTVPMSIREKRLELIRERHRELILAPRERVQIEAFQDEWDDFDYFEDDETLENFDFAEEDDKE